MYRTNSPSFGLAIVSGQMYARLFSTPPGNGVDEAFMDKATKSTRERNFGAMAKGVRGLVLRLGLHTLYIPQSQESFEASSCLAFLEARTGVQSKWPSGRQNY